MVGLVEAGTLMARPPNSSLKKAADAALAPILHDLPPAPTAQQLAGLASHGQGSMIVQSGRADLLCWLKFLGYTDRQAAAKLNVSHDSVSNLVKSPFFQVLYEQRRSAMLAKVDAHFRETLQEEVLKSINVLVEIRDDKNTAKRVRAEVAQALVKLYEKFVGVGKGAPSNILERLSKFTTRRKPDGTVIETSETTERAPREVWESLRPNEPAPGGEGDGVVSEAGPEHRGAGADEAHGGADQAGDSGE